MAQGPSDTILVAIWITLRIRKSKVRNPDPLDRRRFVLSEHISCSFFISDGRQLLSLLLSFEELTALLVLIWNSKSKSSIHFWFVVRWCKAEGGSVEVVLSEGQRAGIVALGQTGTGTSSQRLEEEI